MGVGKTTVGQALKIELEQCVFLDGDWCWDMHPFQVTPETKALVLDNICAVLNNYIQCPAFNNIIFCWVMHEQMIIDEILSKLDTTGCQIVKVSLVCTEDALRERIEKDIEKKLRKKDVMERSLAYLPLYDALDTVKIDVSGKALGKIAEEIMHIKE